MKKVLSRKNQSGFTLIELMVVMAIIAVLAVLIIGAITIARQTSTETVHRSNAKTIQTALEGAFAKDKSYNVTASTGSLQAAATDLGVSIETGSTLGTCAALGADIGGGAITALTATTYTIRVQNSGCTGYLVNDDLTVN